MVAAGEKSNQGDFSLVAYLIRRAHDERTHTSHVTYIHTHTSMHRRKRERAGGGDILHHRRRLLGQGDVTRRSFNAAQKIIAAKLVQR